MVRLTGMFSRLARRKVLVAGDFLLDTYTIGKARRISPEAPVAVVHVQKEEHRPGGAGNVALNLVSMGCQPIVIGRMGLDPYGESLLASLSKENIDTRGMIQQAGYPTPIKNRIIAENQQIVRVDHEVIMPLSLDLERKLIDNLPSLMEGVDLIAISDYGKGFLSNALLSEIIDIGRDLKIPIIADPKGSDFTKYRRSSIIKPNLSEVYVAANLPSHASLDLAAQRVLEQSDCDVLMVTRSEAGISIFHRNEERQDFPVRAREVKDVTGAGDTVLAMMACALANGLSIPEAVQLSNVAAGIAIERFGCARVTLSDLARRLLENDVANKVFDEEHLFALQNALHGRKLVVLGVSASKGLTSRIFSSIRQLSQKDDADLLLYIKDEDPDEEFVSLLSSLHDVDFILVNGASLRSLCDRIAPSEVYEVHDEAFHQHHNAEALFST